MIKVLLFLPKWLFLGIILFYRKYISPFLGSRCRFYPTCSEYAYGCLKEFMFPKAIFKITFRLLRCAPWSKGGYDPVIKNQSIKEDTYV